MGTITVGSELTLAQRLCALCSPNQLSLLDFLEPQFYPLPSAGDFVPFCVPEKDRGDVMLAQLKARRPLIPTLFLANVRSLDNKVDLLRLRLSVSIDMRNCAVLCLTETWLNYNMPDSAFQIDGLQLFRADRDHRSGKTQGGGLCVYVNEGWCTNCGLVKSYCSETIELMTVKCRPYYLPTGAT